MVFFGKSQCHNSHQQGKLLLTFRQSDLRQWHFPCIYNLRRTILLELMLLALHNTYLRDNLCSHFVKSTLMLLHKYQLST